MANDLDAQMKFMLQQQGRFGANMQALKDRQVESARQIKAHRAVIEAHTAQFQRYRLA